MKARISPALRKTISQIHIFSPPLLNLRIRSIRRIRGAFISPSHSPTLSLLEKWPKLFLTFSLALTARNISGMRTNFPAARSSSKPALSRAVTSSSSYRTRRAISNWLFGRRSMSAWRNGRNSLGSAGNVDKALIPCRFPQSPSRRKARGAGEY